MVAKPFWSYVDKRGPDECWPWLGGSTGRYGAYRDGRAHRFAWELANNARVPKGLSVLHNKGCDGHCCNPAHLRCGTHQQNMRDRTEHGVTWARGNRSGGRTVWYNPINSWDGSIA